MWSLIEDVVATEVEDEDGVKMCMFSNILCTVAISCVVQKVRLCRYF